MELPDALAEMANKQSGVLTRRQILAAGLPVQELRTAIGQRFRVLLPGVLLLNQGLPSVDQRLVAAQLFAGPDAWLASTTAAAIHRLPHTPAVDDLRRVELLVPAPRRPRDVSWVSIRRTHLLDERLVERGCLRVSCKARSVVDAAAAAGPDRDTRAIILAAVQRRLVRADDVLHWIEARRPNGRLRLRAALGEAMAGVWSVPEGDLVRLLRTSRVLPEVMANPELTDDRGRRLTTPDVWIDDVALAVMVHSRQFHSDELDWEATVESDADLAAARVVVVPVTPASIERQPQRVLERIEGAYVQAKASRLRASVTATPRLVFAKAS